MAKVTSKMSAVKPGKTLPVAPMAKTKVVPMAPMKKLPKK
jgi:hypothetical protein